MDYLILEENSNLDLLFDVKQKLLPSSGSLESNSKKKLKA